MSARNMACVWEIFYIVRAYFTPTQIGVNWHICMNVWRRYLEYYRTNVRTLEIFLTHQLVYNDTLWQDHTNVRPFPDGKLPTHRKLYGNTVQYYWKTISQWRGIYTACNFYCYYLSKRLLETELRITISKRQIWSRPSLKIRKCACEREV